MDEIQARILTDQIFQAVPDLEERGQKIHKAEGMAGLEKFIDSVLAEHLPKVKENDWDRNPELRREFGNNFDAYKAYLAAETAGRIRIIGSKIIR